VLADVELLHVTIHTRITRSIAGAVGRIDVTVKLEGYFERFLHLEPFTKNLRTRHPWLDSLLNFLQIPPKIS